MLASVAVVLVNGLRTGLTENLTAPLEHAIAGCGLHCSLHGELLVTAEILTDWGVKVNGTAWKCRAILAHLHQVFRYAFPAICI